MSEDIKLIEDPEDIHLNENREIQQILGDPPGWILRWGISLVFLTVGVLAVLSWLIKFPDIISVPFVLTTENPPIEVFTRTNGKIKVLSAKPKQVVAAGDLLAVIENPADFKDVETLERFLNNADRGMRSLLKLKFPKDLDLGIIQPVLAQFMKDLEELRYVYYQNNTVRQVAALDEQISRLRSLNESLETQKATLAKVVALSLKNFERHRELLDKQVTSEMEVEAAEGTYLQSKQRLENMSTEIINNQLRIEQLSLEIIQIKQGQKDQQFPRYFAVQEDLQKLKNTIEQWKETYLIYAPISGTVEMDKVWSPNQYLQASEVLLTIVPENVSNVIKSKAFLPFAGAGKVIVGETPANLRFNAYPFKEFGIIRSEVTYIAEVPQPEGYPIEFAIPQNLRTTYDKDIPFRQGMQGSARLVTKDRRILERIFERILSATKNADSK